MTENDVLIDCLCTDFGEGGFLYSDDNCPKCGGIGWIILHNNSKELKEHQKLLTKKRLTPMEDKVIQAVCDDLMKRSVVGIKKYGVTLERTDLSLRDWLQHAYEETLDSANYLKRTIMEIDKEL